jgi:alcohol dehydrogenase
MFSLAAFRLTAPSLTRVLSAPTDIEARGRMLLGAALAGTAIENSMLGAAHAAANPLTARYGVVHGEAVGILLPAVVRFNAAAPAARDAYAQLAAAIGIAVPDNPSAGADRLVEHLEDLLNTAQIAPSLADLGVSRNELSALAEQAAKQWTANFNPRPTSPKDFQALYEVAFEPREVW